IISSTRFSFATYLRRNFRFAKGWDTNLVRDLMERSAHAVPLQSQFPRAIVSEQIPVSDVAPDHLGGLVAGLSHDATLRGTSNGRAGSVPGPERVPSIFYWIQPGT